MTFSLLDARMIVPLSGAYRMRQPGRETCVWITALLTLWIGLIAVSMSGSAAAADRLTILAFGDSLTAGYGLPAEQGLPAQLEAALRERGWPVDVIDAGISGETTAGGRARLDWNLAERPDAVILALGANDMLRGIDPANSRENLAAMIETIKQREIPLLLAGMLAQRNLGPDYQQAFEAIYPELAAEYDVALMPFLLEGVALDPSLNQPDGIHPNAAGVAVIVENMLEYLTPLLMTADTDPAR